MFAFGYPCVLTCYTIIYGTLTALPHRVCGAGSRHAGAPLVRGARAGGGAGAGPGASHSSVQNCHASHHACFEKVFDSRQGQGSPQCAGVACAHRDQGYAICRFYGHDERPCWREWREISWKLEYRIRGAHLERTVKINVEVDEFGRSGVRCSCEGFAVPPVRPAHPRVANTFSLPCNQLLHDCQNHATSCCMIVGFREIGC